jgi:hypothetical protein
MLWWSVPGKEYWVREEKGTESTHFRLSSNCIQAEEDVRLRKNCSLHTLFLLSLGYFNYGK